MSRSWELGLHLCNPCECNILLKLVQILFNNSFFYYALIMFNYFISITFMENYLF